MKDLPKLKLDKKRFRVKYCPCAKSNKDGKFVPYVGFEDKGYCHGCGQTFLPELPQKDPWNKPQARQFRKPKADVKPTPKPSFITIEIFKQSLKNYNENNFVEFIIRLFGHEIAGKLVSRYFIGTSHHWPGTTVFWQIDIKGKIRAGKIMLYNAETWINQHCSYKTWMQAGAVEYIVVFIYCADMVIETKFDKRLRLLRADALTVDESVRSIDVYRKKHSTYASAGGGKFLTFIK